MAEPIYRYGIKLTPKGNHNLQFRKPKLEIGTVVTDWSPAPEDPDKDAMELISILQTDFSVVQGEIQAKVWETDIQKATEGVYENITELYSYINETINGITAEVGNLTYIVDENYQSLTAQISTLIMTDDEITSRVLQVEQTMATTDFVYSEMDQLSNRIKLSVNSASNGSASIVLSVNDTEAGKGEILADGVRDAFVNDTSAATITAGTVTFNSNTFIVNSTYFSVTASGVITATSGTIGGFTINQNALFNNLSGTDDSTANGIYLGKEGIRVNGQYAGVRMNAQNVNDTYGGGIYFYHYSQGFCGAIYPSSGTNLRILTASYADDTNALRIELYNNSHEILINCDSLTMNTSSGYTGTISSLNSLRFENGICVNGY